VSEAASSPLKSLQGFCNGRILDGTSIQLHVSAVHDLSNWSDWPHHALDGHRRGILNTPPWSCRRLSYLIIYLFLDLLILYFLASKSRVLPYQLWHTCFHYGQFAFYLTKI